MRDIAPSRLISVSVVSGWLKLGSYPFLILVQYSITPLTGVSLKLGKDFDVPDMRVVRVLINACRCFPNGCSLSFTACFISFSTGTSWGTFAILVPLGVPIAHQMGINLSLVVAAILSGGVFGDHCSPISDTTIISSMACASDHIDHVQTQLPYAMTAAVGAVVLFLLFGLLS